MGVCHGVIQRIAPGATVIDIAHGSAAHDVLAAALVLRERAPLHAAPESTSRSSTPASGRTPARVALRCGDGDLLVGPDNGLLWPAAQACGGVEPPRSTSPQSPLRLEPVSATFHGRDLFAPVAARLALGAALEDAGQPIDPRRDWCRLELPAPRGHGARRSHAVLRRRPLREPAAAPRCRRPGTRRRASSRATRRGAVGRRAGAAPSRAAPSRDVGAGEAWWSIEDSSGTIAVAVEPGQRRRRAAAPAARRRGCALASPADDR